MSAPRRIGRDRSVGNEADGGRFASIETSFEMPSTPSMVLTYSDGACARRPIVLLNFLLTFDKDQLISRDVRPNRPCRGEVGDPSVRSFAVSPKVVQSSPDWRIACGNCGNGR